MRRAQNLSPHPLQRQRQQWILAPARRSISNMSVVSIDTVWIPNDKVADLLLRRQWRCHRSIIWLGLRNIQDNARMYITAPDMFVHIPSPYLPVSQWRANPLYGYRERRPRAEIPAASAPVPVKSLKTPYLCGRLAADGPIAIFLRRATRRCQV